MKLYTLGLIHKNQRGLTLIGLIIAIAIAGIISTGVTITISQMFDHSARTSARMTAIKQLENASYYINRDGQMAQTIEIADPDPDGFPLTLTWVEWDSNNEIQVVYSIAEADKQLIREHYTNRATNPLPDETTFAAQHLDADQSSCGWNATEGKLTFMLTCAVSSSGVESVETRTWELTPRPSS